jgi:large subunit ribosomal protein L28
MLLRLPDENRDIPPATPQDLRILGMPEFTVSASEVFGVTVAANCDVCGKGPGFGNNISHSHRRTPRRWNPNIQRVRAVVGRTPKRLNVCTSCIKAGKVSR